MIGIPYRRVLRDSLDSLSYLSKSLERFASIPGIRLLVSPITQVATCGLISLLVYVRFAQNYPLAQFVQKFPLTDLGRVNNWSQPALYELLFSLTVLFGVYLIAWQIVQHHRDDKRLLWVILAFAGLFAVTMLFMYPVGATDIFEYAFHSRILVHYQQNPLAVPPKVFVGDPMLKTVNWAAHPSPYGPLWALLTVPFGAIGGSDLILNLYLFKVETAFFFLADALMVFFILRQFDRQHRLPGFLLLAWSPLAIFEWPGNGHNDSIMIFFVLLSVYFLVRKQWTWVIPALVASVLIKYISAILLIPFLIYLLHVQTGGWRSKLMFLVKTGLITSVVVGVLISPFLAVPTGLLEEAGFYSLLAAPTLAFQVLKTIHGEQVAKVMTLEITSLAYLAVYAVSLLYLARRPNTKRLLVLGAWLTIGYLVIACLHFQPWFVLWPTALGVWLNHSDVRRVIIAFDITAMLAYAGNFVWIWNIRVWQQDTVNEMYIMLIYLVPLAVGLFGLARFTYRRMRVRRFRPAFAFSE